MFTGIITDVTEVIDSQLSGKGLNITFKKPSGWTNLEAGESINTDGVCLTVATQDVHSYSCHLMPETLKLTTFGLKVPSKVNLERALMASDRLGGHFLQGHTDDMGQVVKIDKAQNWDLYIKFSPTYRNLVVYKGSIGINGVSLTVTGTKDTVLGVSLVPYTLDHTTLDSLKVDGYVNLEFDIIGKYIAANMESRSAKS